MNVLDLMRERWGVDINRRSPIEVPNVSREKEFLELMRDAGFKIGVEVGVQQGKYSERLCQLIPGLKLYSVDPWETQPGYRKHISQNEFNGFYEEAKERLAPYDCTLVKEYSVDAARMFEDGSIDFVYIDGHHDFANVVRDIAAWSPKVRKGGIISGHDFRQPKRNRGTHNIVEAVNGWTQSYNIAPWFILGRRKIRPGEARDRNRSWMWVR